MNMVVIFLDMSPLINYFREWRRGRMKEWGMYKTGRGKEEKKISEEM